MSEPEVLDEITMFRSGSFKRVKRYLRGVWPDRGKIEWGYTGWETVEETSVITPIGTFEVVAAVAPPAQHAASMDLAAVG